MATTTLPQHPDEIRNPKNRSGYDGVVGAGPKGSTKWRAEVYGGTLTKAGHLWWGHSRSTELEAAWDKINYLNGRPIAPPEKRMRKLTRTVTDRIRTVRGATKQRQQWEQWQRDEVKGRAGGCEARAVLGDCCPPWYSVDSMECHHIILEKHGVANGACLCPNAHKLANAEQNNGGGPITNHLLNLRIEELT